MLQKNQNSRQFSCTAMLLLVSSVMLAQPTGYFGRRCSVGYTVYLFPSFMGPTSSSEDMGFNITHSIGLDYSNENSTNFCIDVQYVNTGLKANPISYTYVDPYYGDQYYQLTYTNLKGGHKPINLRSINLALGFKFFGRGRIAPIGFYFKPELILLMENVNYDPYGFSGSFQNGNQYAATPEFSTISVGKGSYSHNSFSVAAGIGRQRALSNRFLIDYGVRGAITLSGVGSYLAANYDYGTGYETLELALKSWSNKRMLRYQFLNFYIGIRYLLF